MKRELTREYFEGTVTSDKTKEFLVDLARAGACTYLRMETIKDDMWPKKVMSIYDQDPAGLSVRCGFIMKKRENECGARLQDNPSIKKFVEKYGLFMK